MERGRDAGVPIRYSICRQNVWNASVLLRETMASAMPPQSGFSALIAAPPWSATTWAGCRADGKSGLGTMHFPM